MSKALENLARLPARRLAAARLSTTTPALVDDEDYANLRDDYTVRAAVLRALDAEAEQTQEHVLRGRTGMLVAALVGMSMVVVLLIIVARSATEKRVGDAPLTGGDDLAARAPAH
ncbi:MAG: hypothetical protein R2699_18030 [Acidimicrobiales bacterium]